MYKILGIVGPSGSGKDYMASYITSLYPDVFHEVILDTTRPPRDNEKDGINYYFTTPPEFYNDLMTGKILSVSSFNDWYYGINKESLDENKINVIVLDPDLLARFEKGDIQELKTIYIFTKDKKRLIQTLKREKKSDCKEICRRFLADKEVFNQFTDFDYPILNNYNKKFNKKIKKIAKHIKKDFLE